MTRTRPHHLCFINIPGESRPRDGGWPPFGGIDGRSLAFKPGDQGSAGTPGGRKRRPGGAGRRCPAYRRADRHDRIPHPRRPC